MRKTKRTLFFLQMYLVPLLCILSLVVYVVTENSTLFMIMSLSLAAIGALIYFVIRNIE